MRKLLSITLVTIFSFLSSCTNNEEVSIDSNSKIQENINSVLAEMKSLGDSQGKIIVYEVKNISKKDYQKYFEVIKNSKKVLDFALGSDSNQRKGPGDNYTVTCTWGNGETTVTECGESTSCAGQATWDCLENGGCATICNAKITYTPSKIKPYQVPKKEAIESVLKQAVKISSLQNEAISFSIAYDKEKYWLKNTTSLKKESFSTLSRKRPGTFQVDCYGSDGELMWSDTYYDDVSASQGILDCTDRDGGCAEICEIYARYFPKEKI